MLLKHKFNDFECIIYGFILNFNTILIYLNLNTVKDVFFSKKKKKDHALLLFIFQLLHSLNIFDARLSCRFSQFFIHVRHFYVHSHVIVLPHIKRCFEIYR